MKGKILPLTPLGGPLHSADINASGTWRRTLHRCRENPPAVFLAKAWDVMLPGEALRWGLRGVWVLTPERLRGTLPSRPKVLERWSYLSFRSDLRSQESTIYRLSRGKGAKNIVTSLGGIQARPTDGNWHGMALYTLSSWRRRNLNSDEFIKMLHIIWNKRMGDRSRSAYMAGFNLLWSWIAWQLATFL